jgi:hypothetical protein
VGGGGDVWTTVSREGDGSVTVSPSVTVNGQYELLLRGVDAAGNVGASSSVVWWLDATPPPPPQIIGAPTAVTLSTGVSVEVVLRGDRSPGTVTASFELSWVPDGVDGARASLFASGSVSLLPVTLVLPGAAA